MPTSRPAAVLWDMDGTIVDTEPYWMQAETELIESYGGIWTHEQALTLVGKGLLDSAAVLQSAGVEMPAQEIVNHLTRQVISALSTHGNPFRPGAAELLADLRAQGVRNALVTMSLREMADVVAAQIPFDAFDVIISGTEATAPKPAPDPYLQACAALGISPGDAVAIEDSPTGVASATSAGVVTIGVPLMLPLADTAADEIWPTLAGRTTTDITAVWKEHQTDRKESTT